MGFDLHMHSIYSDGYLTPGRLVAEAVSLGLDGIALTDHDTVDGLEEFLAAAREQNLRVIPGIELTTDYGMIEGHILGYRIDFEAEVLCRKLETVLEARNERALEMIKRLARHRIILAWEEVKELSQARFIGRSHLFKAMENRGYVDRTRRGEVFEYYLGNHGVGYVPHREIETREAIELILAAGGIPVLAHPGRAGDECFIRQLVDYGLGGLEVYYPSHSPEQVKRYLELALELELVVTGGSDYHGILGRARMGEAMAPELTV